MPCVGTQRLCGSDLLGCMGMDGTDCTRQLFGIELVTVCSCVVDICVLSLYRDGVMNGRAIPRAFALRARGMQRRSATLQLQEQSVVVT